MEAVETLQWESAEKKVILAVDDEPANLDLIELIFSEYENIEVIKAYNGQEAIDLIKQRQDIDIILLDIFMPVKNGIETLKELREDLKIDIPIIVLTADPQQKYEALKHKATDFLTKPIDPEEVQLRTFNYIDIKRSKDFLKNVNKILEEKVQERTKQLKEAFDYISLLNVQVIEILGDVSEYRDLETGKHIKRIKLYTQKMLDLLGIEDDGISIASMLHDIGKIGIPDAILLKPGKLLPHEFEIMKMHSTIGYQMLALHGEKFPILQKAAIIAYTHHEKWDGTGYPRGLKGEDIPIEGRITAIVDVFDALVSKRVYKPAMSYDKALSIIEESAGKHFDPKLVEIFLKHKEEFIKIKEENPDDDKLPSILAMMEDLRRLL
ncbi:MAG: HD domain-containing phosphohydrolase [Hydrogenothermaceae bacterium]